MIRVACLTAALAGACTAPASPSGPSRPVDQLKLLDLVGDWRWLLRTEEGNTSRVEDEQWHVGADLRGAYVRTVEVRSTDSVPFTCNQRPWYRQRSFYRVALGVEGADTVVREDSYETEPSPCDHGFRSLATYRAEPRGERMVLHFAGGEQTLWHVGSEPTGVPEKPWTVADLAGAWRWQNRSWDDDGNIYDEAEWWEVTRRNDTQLDATYRRRVTTTSVDGKPLACAGAPSWTFDDAYVLEGEREEEHWHFHERAVEAGEHPCLRASPKRALDEATAEQLGDYLVLEWRGKRRQVLYRSD